MKGERPDKHPWAVEYRMAWVKESVEIFGRINRDNICRKFRVSTQQAAADIKLVLERWPELMAYNKSTKRYERNCTPAEDSDA